MNYNPTDALKASSAAITGIGKLNVRVGAMLAAMAEPPSPSLNAVPPSPDAATPLMYYDLMKLRIRGGDGQLILFEGIPFMNLLTNQATPVQLTARNLTDSPDAQPQVLPFAINQHAASRPVLVEVRYLFDAAPYPAAGGIAAGQLQLLGGPQAINYDLQFNLYPPWAWGNN